VPVAAPEPTDTTQAKTVSGMEWTRTFLRDTQTHNNVGRKRMCIVQKEDSLDSIAARYGIHSQELVMFNRLADRQLQTGQILYIPLSG
jgi:stage VI sporulation protein D